MSRTGTWALRGRDRVQGRCRFVAATATFALLYPRGCARPSGGRQQPGRAAAAARPGRALPGADLSTAGPRAEKTAWLAVLEERPATGEAGPRRLRAPHRFGKCGSYQGARLARKAAFD